MLTQWEFTFIDADLFAYIAAIFVSVIWLLFLWYSQKTKRIPWYQMILLFLLSALFGDVCHYFYDHAHYNLAFYENGEFYNDLYYLWSINGLGEEIVKFIPWILFGLFTKKLNDLRNFILLAAISGLGFAFQENLTYYDNTANITVRAIMCAVGHMALSSTVAFLIVLARFKVKNTTWSYGLIAVAIPLAAILHGTYNFTLSNSFSQFYVFHFVIFFVLAWLWFYYQRKTKEWANQAEINYNSEQHNERLIDIVTFGIITTLMLEFLFVSLEYGANDGNIIIGRRFILIAFFIVFVSLTLDNINLKTLSSRYKLQMPGEDYFDFISPNNTSTTQEVHADMSGLELRIFASKKNPYIGNKMPRTGICIKKVTVNNDPNWHVLQLKKPMPFRNYHPGLFIIKPVNSTDRLDDDKIPIYFLFIPDKKLLQMKNIDVKRLRTAGKAFSRPVNL
jgi:RsiW-degrading membrane proteinase PrsW (M82 family)